MKSGVQLFVCENDVIFLTASNEIFILGTFCSLTQHTHHLPIDFHLVHHLTIDHIASFTTDISGISQSTRANAL